eukprot:8328030-Pyramimonas_sp.AAC.1
MFLALLGHAPRTAPGGTASSVYLEDKAVPRWPLAYFRRQHHHQCSTPLDPPASLAMLTTPAWPSPLAP